MQKDKKYTDTSHIKLNSYVFEGRLNFQGKTFNRTLVGFNVVDATKACLKFIETEQTKLGISYLEKPQHNGEWLIEYCRLENGSTLCSGTMKDLVNGLLTIESLKDL